jgi:hypothetical protein
MTASHFHPYHYVITRVITSTVFEGLAVRKAAAPWRRFAIGGGKEIGAVVFTTAPYPKAPELPVVKPAIP